MTDPFAVPSGSTPQQPPASGQQPPAYGQPPAPGYGQPPAGYGQPGQIGEIRPTGKTILLFFVTFGIYGLFYYFKTHEEMKLHTGQGLGGLVALLLAVFVGFVNPFLLSDEVGKLYSRRGQSAPVTAMTGLWFIPGFLLFIIVGPIIWFVKTNGALNDYWRSVGAQG